MSLHLRASCRERQIKYSKKGNRFCIFRLEDRSTGVKCLVWAEAFSKCSDLIVDDAMLIAEGRVETAEGAELTIIVNEVRSLADAESNNARRMSIGLPSDVIGEDYLFELYSLLGESRGSCEVSLNIPVNGIAVEIDAHSFRIKGSGKLETALKAKGCTVAWHL